MLYIYKFIYSKVKPYNILTIFLLLCLVLLPGLSSAQFYQGYQTNFGKNRVQYQDFLWTFYRFKNFDTYFYLGGQEHALFIGRTADQHIQELEKLLDYRLDNRIQFVIYNTLSEYHQSNITLDDETQNNNIGGFTRIVGNRVLLYFDGNHEHFVQQMRAGITQVLIDQLMYGGDIKERFQNAVLLNLPPWYIQGLVSYASSEWSVELDNKLRDAIVSGRFKKFNRLSAEDAQLAGHSMWRYIANIYGESAISNLLYMSRVNRNIDSGFLFVLGVSLKTLSKNWLQYYQNMYFDTDKNRVLPQGELIVQKPKSNLIYKNLKISPGGDKAAFVTNDLGKHKLFIYDFQRKKSKKILKYGHKSMIEKSDEFYPLIEWHPTGRILTMIRKKKGNVIISYYNIDDKKWETLPLFYFDKVLAFDYSPDGQNIVLSAVQKGKSDIFIFNIRTRTYDQVTNDMDDDFYPVYLQDNSSLVFSSNRLNDTIGAVKTEYLPDLNNLDLFIYDYNTKSPVLKRITNTPSANEIMAQPYDSTYFTYLSDANGIYNRYAGAIDSVISHIDTTEHYRYIITNSPQSNYVRNVLQHDVNYRKSRYGQIMYHEGKYKMYVSVLPPVINDNSINKVNTPYRQKFTENIETTTKKDSATPKTETTAPVIKLEPFRQDTGKIDINNYVFQSEVNRPKQKKQETKKKLEVQLSPSLSDTTLAEETPQQPAQDILPIQRNYEIAYEANYLVSQLDNSLLNNTYQTFSGGGVYYDPGINGLFKIGISDLMGDYKMTGGMRISPDLTSTEYLLSYESLKKRFDKQIVLFRHARMTNSAFTYLKINTHEAKFIGKWPFSNISSIRGTIGYRNDRQVFLSTDLRNLQEPNIYSNWGTAKVEYIFDNTINLGVNLYNGTRYKFFGEWFRELDKQESNIYIVGADFRHYQKVHRQIIWANRFAASTSFGDKKLIYYLGSTDNVIVPVRNFNDDISIDFTQNYAFQAVATNLRGFTQNIRNGNSFALINSEIRIPLFQYIINRPIRSDFIRNFQVVGFADAGTAWTGSSPYSSENALNTQTIHNGPLTISITRQIEPIVAGYGIGLRSRLLGYFIRGDWAWGVEDREVKKPIFYLSLSLDF